MNNNYKKLTTLNILYKHQNKINSIKTPIMSTSVVSNKSSYQAQGHNPQSQYPNPSPSQSLQNIKYFLENYKTSEAKSIFSEKFTNSGLYSENSQIPDSFYKLHRPFDRNSAFFVPHGNRRNGSYYKNKNWYPKYPMILSKKCELVRKGKGNNNSDYTAEESVNDVMMKSNKNKFFTIKYVLDNKNEESGPFPANVTFTFLKNYYIDKTREEKDKMNMLIHDMFDDSCFAPEIVYDKLLKEFGNDNN